jgi:protein-tyrosine phosphatase
MPDRVSAVEQPPAPRHPNVTYRVLVVCLGNICRSPTAEVVLREELAVQSLTGRVEVESAGTGDWHLGQPMDPGARAELSQRGFDGSRHQARQIDPSWFPRFDLILAMDKYNLADLKAMAPDEDSRSRVRLLRCFDPDTITGGTAGGAGSDPYDGDVPDPYHGSAEDYALAFDLIRAASIGLSGRLQVMLERRKTRRLD